MTQNIENPGFTYDQHADVSFGNAVSMDDQLFCEPCKLRSQEAPATHYCQDCEKKFCSSCTSSHQNQKATKKHKLVDVKLAARSVSWKKCEPCELKSRITKATFVCKNCEEFLCDNCKNVHLSQRHNKDHIMISITEVLCEPCKNIDKREQASAYCLDCDDPEVMCPSCADQHTVMKQTRSHRLSHNLATFILRHKGKEIIDGNIHTTCMHYEPAKNQPACGPCEYQKRTESATNYCRNCDEMMCDSCTVKHRSTKKFSGDDIVEVSSILKTPKICEPCKYNKKEKGAIYICRDCEEHLCEECKNTHLSQKKNRSHTIMPLSTSVGCVNCSEAETLATSYCEECQDPICDACAEHHKAMKVTRNHNISSDLTRCIPKSVPIDASDKGQMALGPTSQYTGGARPKILHNFQDAQHAFSTLSAIYCEPCETSEKQIDATFFCKECEENLCEECLEFHQASNENKDHAVQSLSKEIVLCSTCKAVGKKVKAICCCQDCSESYPFCNDCAVKHPKMKKTRGHNMSFDITKIPVKFRTKETSTHRVEVRVEPMQQKVNEINTQDSADYLGKPYTVERKSDNIVLQWRSEHKLSDYESYQIMYKEEPKGKWRPYTMKEPCNKPKVTIQGLKANTSYIFKVRLVNDNTGEERQFSAESDVIKTMPSPALGILETAEKIDYGPPEVYRLPIKENVTARNEKAKTRKFALGREGTDTIEKTIMIVGATGSGKSTLINGMANYIMGVSWEDPFRFTLINLETCEQKREGNEALSQTEWVTCYTLHSDVSDRIDYTINLIDTPGFGDTRGLEQDANIIDQIRQLFTAKGEQGVATLDAVCFILKAPDARLTATQRYIFESILSLFGNDIKSNICTLITFADGQRPPVLAGIQALDGIPLPHDIFFTFNNSALFVDNTPNTPNNLSSFFWDMGIKSCATFFDHLTTLQMRSLSLTTEVLQKRQKLENTVKHLQEEIEVGLSKINVLEREVDLFSKNAQAILENKDFEYVVEEDYQEKIDLSGKGQYTTNCLICNFTCHENCGIANDADKAGCVAINKEGKCRECPKSCHWKEHHNTPYIIKWSKRKVKKKYDEMKKKYEEATQRTLTQEQVLEEMGQDIARQEQAIQVMMEVISKLTNRLKVIALRPDPLSTVQYIDLMIASENREKKSGFEARIEALQNCKNRTTYNESVQIFRNRVGNTRQNIQKVAASDVAEEILKDDNKSFSSRVKEFLGMKK